MQSIIRIFEKPKLTPGQPQQVNDVKLSINHICPKMSARFEMNKLLPVPISLTWFKRLYEIISSSKCVVGEAHGFSSSYGWCEECCKFSYIFPFYFMMHSHTNLKEMMQRLVEHWSETHYALREEKNSEAVMRQ